MYDVQAEAKPASSNTQGIMATESEPSGCEAESEYYVMVRPGRLLMKITAPTKESSKNGGPGFKQGRKVRCSKCQRPENDTTWRNMKQAKILHAGHYWWDNTCPKCLMKETGKTRNEVMTMIRQQRPKRNTASLKRNAEFNEARAQVNEEFPMTHRTVLRTLTRARLETLLQTSSSSSAASSSGILSGSEVEGQHDNENDVVELDVWKLLNK